MMKRQFWLIGIVLLAALSACRSKSKDGPTDTYSSGVIAIAADESFEPIIQEEIDVFESLYPLAGIVPRYTTEVEAINLLLKDSVRLAITTRTLTEEQPEVLSSGDEAGYGRAGIDCEPCESGFFDKCV